MRFLSLVLLCSLSACSVADLTQRSSQQAQISQVKTLDAERYLISQEAIGRFGGTLRKVSKGTSPKTLNPWISDDATSSNIAGKLFEGLLVKDPDTDQVVPHMASGFEIKQGGKQIIVKLRPGLKWTDGHAITADDVIYTWNTLLRDGVAVSSLRDILLVDGKFPKVTKLDDLSLSFETEEVFAPFLDLIGIAIAPKHDILRFFEEHGAKTHEQKQKAFENYLNVFTKPEEIVSSGAFKLSKIKAGERIEFNKNPNYFVINQELKRLPYVDKLVITLVEDESATIFKFLAKEAHMIDVSPANAATIKGLEQQYGFTLYDMGPSSGTNFVWFNMSANVPEPQYSWFNDINFRTAVSYAIDRENMVNNVYQGLGVALFTAEPQKSPYYNQNLQGYARDLSKAQALLAESGFAFKDTEFGKQLYDSDSNRVEFELYTNAGSREREQMSSIVVSNLAELGIKVNFKPIEFNNLVSRIMAGKNYEAMMIGLTGGNEPHGGANVWKSDGRLHAFDIRSGDKLNPVRAWEKRIDKLFAQGVKSLDFEQRKKIYDEFQTIVYKNNPFVYLVSPKSLTAVSNELGNVRRTKYAGVIPHIYEAYIKP